MIPLTCASSGTVIWVTWVIDDTVTSNYDNWPPWPPPPPPRRTPPAPADRKAWHRALSLQAVHDAQQRLRAAQDDTTDHVPPQRRDYDPRRHLPRNRVCAGSSRYRAQP